MVFTLEVRTTPGIADSEFLDRLADSIYESDQLVDPLLALNDDDSLDISFGFDAARATDAFAGVTIAADALVRAKPVRGSANDALIDSFRVTGPSDRDAVAA